MRIPILGLLAAVLLSLSAAGGASAATAPCVVGQSSPQCHVFEGKVKWAADGDTFRPQLKLANGKWSKYKVAVRMIGIQAPELSEYSRKKGRKGNCMGVEAAEVLDSFIARKQFRMVALKKESTTKGKRARLRRTVQVKQGGRWIDPAMELLRRGLVLWFPNENEWPWNEPYARLAQEAQARGVGLWNPTACNKPGPSQESSLRLKVKWDGQGTDSKSNLQEWVRITNEDSVNDVSLSGWTLRDSHLRGQKMESGYRFPADAVVPAGGSIKVWVRGGANGNGDYYWGLNEVVFDNATDKQTAMGDGAYLFDPDSELRAYVQYPCYVNCGDSLDNKIRVTARYLGVEHEWVTVTNISSETLSLSEYEIENVPWFYEFDSGDVLRPGRSVTLWVSQPHPVPLDLPGRKLLVPVQPGVDIAGLRDFASSDYFRSWGHVKGVLNDGGDYVMLRTPNGLPVAGGCHSWGGMTCPSV